MKCIKSSRSPFFFLIILHTQAAGTVGKQLNQTYKRQEAIYFVYLFISDRSAFF